MPSGTVKFFNVSKGFGFITPDGGSKDVFVPAASIGAVGIPALKTGQRVSFEETPDSKGPKAVNLKLLEMPVVAGSDKYPAKSAEKAAEPISTTIYCDLSSLNSEEVLLELREGGQEPRVVDYMVTPPTREKLKELSLLLRGPGQSLVKKYDQLFNELRLDDRFISENEFWDSVVEHPALINGPVIATASRAAICQSPKSVKAFLASDVTNHSAPNATQKALTPRLLKILTGDAPGLALAPEKGAQSSQSKPNEIKPTNEASVEKPLTMVPKQKKVTAKGRTKAKVVAPNKSAAKSKPEGKSKPKSATGAKAKTKTGPKAKRAQSGKKLTKASAR